MPFDPFRRFRLRSQATPVATLPSESEEDSDRPGPIVHVSATKNSRKSPEPLLTAPRDGKPLARDGGHKALTLDKPPHPSHPVQPSKMSAVVSVSHSVEALQPPTKSTLIRRVTSKLNIAIPLRSGTHALQSRPSTRTLHGDKGPSAQGPRSPIPVTPSLPNGFISKQHREAALRERGLLPPRKDLSEQEREADERLACAPPPVSLTVNGSTEAERLKASWLAASRNSESSDSDCDPPPPSYLQSTRSSSSLPLPDAGVVRRSCDGRTDLPYAGRPSFCSSVPPLSASSHLEVLHEEPSELGPITPPPPLSPAKLPIIVSTLFDSPPSPILVESPVSCTFSSQCPGSTLESHSQSSHPPPVPEKEIIRLPRSRRRTSDSCDRPRKVVGSSLSRLGTHSLTNLRRSVAGSLRAPSSSTLSTTDHSSLMSQAPRMAIDPTMHSIGSILRETRDIKDAESRRLSELAFLD